MARLTKQFVDSAEGSPGKAQTFFWDDKLPGFGLRVTATGTKSFIIEYRARGKAQSRRLTLGQYGKITAEQARKLAHGQFSRIADGSDPLADNKASKEREKAFKAEKTVNDMLDAYLAGYAAKHHKPSTLVREKHSLKKYVRPYLGNLKVSALNNARVCDWYEGLSTPVAANRALAYLRIACKNAKLPSDLCRVIKKNKETAKERYFTDEELARVGAALSAFEAKGGFEASLGFGIRILALTGLRKSEVRNLKWADLDPIKATVLLRDSKTGSRVVPLLDQAATVIAGANRIGEFMVAGANPSLPISDSAMTRAVTSVMNAAKVSGASAHTFRHTLATYMAQHGDSPFQIAQYGGWKRLAMVQRYVTMHSVGKKHPIPAGQRIAVALAGGSVVPLKATA